MKADNRDRKRNSKKRQREYTNNFKSLFVIIDAGARRALGKLGKKKKKKQ